MAESITIQGKKAKLAGGSGKQASLPVDQFVRGLTEATLQGMDDDPIPDSAKWQVRCGSLTVCIVQLTPELRWIKWLAKDSPAPYGPEAVCEERQLATPYVIFKIPFRHGRLIPRVEVFYRNSPVSGLDGDGGALFWPNLLNVSPNSYGVTAWFCTQYISRESDAASRDRQSAVSSVIHHCFGGAFNASSEYHERLSTFSLCQQEAVDPRVTDVDRWENESRKNPRFVLGVKWKPTGLTVRDILERELAFHKLQAVPDSAGAIGNIMLRRGKTSTK